MGKPHEIKVDSAVIVACIKFVVNGEVYSGSVYASLVVIMLGFGAVCGLFDAADGCTV